MFIIIAFVLSSFFPETVSLEGYGQHFDVTLGHLTAFLALLVVAADILRRFYRMVHALFVPSPERRLKEGMTSVQECFEALLLNNTKEAKKTVTKASHILGKDIPLLMWFEGRISCLEGDAHRAQSLFYALNAREDGRFLGSYGLYQMAQKEHDSGKALIALEGAIERYKSSEILLTQAFLLALQEKRFDKARTFLLSFKGGASEVLSTQWEALSYFLEAQDAPLNRSKALLRQSADMAPELTIPAVTYFKVMSTMEKKLRGRALLKRAWRASPHPLIEATFIEFRAPKNPAEKMRMLEGLFAENPESWLSSYGLGKVAYEAGLWGVALQHFDHAYTIFPARACAEKALDLVKILHPEDPEHTPEYIAWLEKYQTGCAMPTWTCTHCAHHLEDWAPFCSVCHSFATVVWSDRLFQHPTVAPSALLSDRWFPG
jgi:HemY protein